MTMLAAPLGLELFAGFNGSAIVRADLTAVEEHVVPAAAARLAVDTLSRHGVDVWVFNHDEWLITNPAGSYVPLELRTVRFEPKVVEHFDDHLDRVGKIVGSSTDFDRLARIEAELQALLGPSASAHRSQLYYLDVTHPLADKAHAVRAFAAHWEVPVGEVAVIGDMANDLPMFAAAGLAVAMGNANAEIQQRAHFVTLSNDEDGWARAVDEFILPRAATLQKRSGRAGCGA
jgi:Cof subfamily protein (haloacid dehalogenase superfamily)